MKIKIEEIRKLCMKALLKQGLSENEAKLIVNEHVEGELRGKKCHGFNAFKKFAVKKIKSKTGEPIIIKESPSHIYLDAKGNIGQIVLDKFLPKIIEKAKKNAISMIGIRNMESYLMPGTFARKIAEKDMVCLLFNYGGKERVAPTGSIDPIFATNPIAVGIPTEAEPIVLDMATSSYAMGKVRLALKLNEEIPKGVAIDKNGKPTTFPDKAMEGALFPFGGYKGSGLCLIIEILTRCLLDVHKKEGEVYRGYFFIIIDPSKFIELKKFKANVEELIEIMQNARKAEGVDEIYLPGEQSDKIKEETLKEGYFEIDDKIIEEIKDLS